MIKLIFLLFILFNYSINSNSMGKKLYHHLPDGTFRNPEGSPSRKAFENLRKGKGWSFRIFNQEKKKINITIPSWHVEEKEKVF